MKAPMVSAVLLLALAAGTVSGQTSITLTLNATTAGATAPVLGVNLGQRFDGETSWTAFLRHMGANGARLFGMNGLISGQSLLGVVTSTAPGSNSAQLLSYGNDFTNTAVTNLATFNAAVAALRKSDFSGRNASNTALAYAAPWATVYGNLQSVDNSTADAQSQGSPAANLAALGRLGVQPLAVQWLSCTILDWKSLSPSAAIYWGERWEVYKYQYVLAYWAYQNGVKRIEYWNEPDLSASCINGTTWLEHVTVRSMAIKHANADANADVAANFTKCPASQQCPFTMQVAVSAFASVSMGLSGPVTAVPTAGPFGSLTVASQNLVFPPQSATTNSSWTNMDVYSFHSYGKTGFELKSAGVDIKANATALLGSNPAVPVIITEHQSHTNDNWNGYPSTTDSPFEGSRFTNQVILSSVNGLDAYAFKFSTTPSKQGGVTKSGLHFADITGSPSSTPGLFPVGDTTYSGEAYAVVAPALAGGKPLATCTASTTVSNSFVCALTKNAAGTVFYLVASNDISGITDSYYPGTTADPAGSAAALTINLAPLFASSNSVAIITEVSGSTYLGEVSLFTSLSGGSSLTKTLPPFGVMRMTVPVNAQTITNVSSTTATVKAGANAGVTTPSVLTVGTSNTAVHDTTSVGMLQFDLTGNTNPAASANAVLLELTVATAASAASVLHVIGLNPCSSMNWTKSNITWAGAPWGLTVPSGTIAAIRNNFALMSGFQPGNNFLGHITVNTGDAGAVKRLDVTQFVQNAAQGGATKVGFMIVRRFRSDGICTGPSCPGMNCTLGVCTAGLGNAAGLTPADTLSGGSAVTFASDTAGSGAPALRIVADATVTGSLSAPVITGYCSGTPSSPAGSPTPAGPTPAGPTPAGSTVAIAGAHTIAGYTTATFGTAQAASLKGILATATGVTSSSVYITSVAAATGSGRRLVQGSVTVGYTVILPSSATVVSAVSSLSGLTTATMVSGGLTACTGVTVATTPAQAGSNTPPADVTSTLPTTSSGVLPVAPKAVSSMAVALAALALAF